MKKKSKVNNALMAPPVSTYQDPSRVSIEKASNGLVVHHSNTGKTMVAKTAKEAFKHAKRLLK